MIKWSPRSREAGRSPTKEWAAWQVDNVSIFDLKIWSSITDWQTWNLSIFLHNQSSGQGHIQMIENDWIITDHSKLLNDNQLSGQGQIQIGRAGWQPTHFAQVKKNSSWILSSPRAESARAVIGRRCPHSGKGEDFLTGQPDFFTETAVTPERKVKKSFPRWEINRHAEG